ncbi:amidohydrolase family protein [Tropicibacter sp. Alg240-R139]|uniref:amidohydrolase family protein n=1 Tax=Tropicibacter sp. Alg240-R139 TaxID=2305991 RepID=UPI0013E00BDC|nr:amidohydrolase family protein [Tropicibacter sp. Alg240-R139]
MAKISNFALALLLACVQATVARGDDRDPIGAAIHDLPIFDAHIHYKEPAWNTYPVESVIEMMDRNGVAMGLVSSTPDEGTIMLWEYAPNRIVPELRPYHGSAGSSNWTKVTDMEAYLTNRLTRFPHEGIGEFHIHRLDTSDEPFFRSVIQMARERDIFLHVHSSSEPIRWLYSLDPQVKIIWAHAGLGDSATTVFDLMNSHPELLADTSLRENEILGWGRGLDPDWKRVIFAFPDRLMVGSDTWVNGQWDDYDEIIQSNRAWLALLPRDIAEQIAYRNAERIFGRSISMDQIGTR